MKTSRRTGTPRIGRAAAALAVAVTSGLTLAGPASARPADGASTLSTTCSISSDLAKTYFGVVCDSFWPWESFTYKAWVECSNGNYHSGWKRDSWSDATWSWAQCEPGSYYIDRGYITGD